MTSAERQRKRWASMTEEERAAYYAKRKTYPSRQLLARVPEYKKRFGDGWLPVHERPFCGVDGEGGTWYECAECMRDMRGNRVPSIRPLPRHGNGEGNSMSLVQPGLGHLRGWQAATTGDGLPRPSLVGPEVFDGSEPTDECEGVPSQVEAGEQPALRGVHPQVSSTPTRSEDGGGVCPHGVRGIHAYGLLTVGTTTLQNADGSPLNSVQCLDFLTSQPKTHRYIIYYGGYDATLIFRDLPVKVQRQIVDGATGRDGKRTFVWWEDYGIDYFPRKLLKIVRKKSHPLGPGSITLYDVSAYFQCAFTQALKDWEVGTEEELEVIARGKESRREFTLPAPPEVLSYNLLECRLLAALVTKMVDAAETLGITLRSYHGPATLATALLEKYNVSDFMTPMETWPEEVQDWVRHAYFGGRFECSAVGIAEEVWELDIASAYPWAMQTLPCQICGEWRKGRAENAQASLHRVSWAVSEGTRWAPFPWRDHQGGLCYPRIGTGVYWGEEVDMAVSLFGESVTVHETWSYVTPCDHRPLAWMAEVYEERKRLGKNAAGRVLKLAMNSAYGVFARTVGGGGTFSNYWWAGQITARTRGRLLEVAHAGGDECFMLATDGAYFSRRQSVPTGNALGDWEDGGQVGPLLLVQPGVYLSLSFEGKKYRTRGVSLKSINALDGTRRLVEAWRAEGPEAVVPMNVAFLLTGQDEPMVFIGTKLALQWGKPELIGSWQSLSKSLSFRPEPRRQRGEWEGELLRTYSPLSPFAALGVPSAPYKKMMKVREEAMMVDQPWLPMGFGHEKARSHE